jgi:Transposase
MRASRFNEEQIIAILREQEAGGKTADVCRKHGVSGATEGIELRKVIQNAKALLEI